MQIKDLLKIQYTPQEIAEKRAEIRRLLISGSSNINSGEINRIAVSDLELLFEYYDAAFFKGYFRKYFPGKLRFSLSTQMTRNAGKTNYLRNLPGLRPEQEDYEIRIGVNFFFNYNKLQRNKAVNGIITKDALEALQLVFEHELVHLIELHCCRKSSCRKERFKTLAKQLFGHLDRYHHLPTEKEIAASRYGFKSGDWVCFSHGGRKQTGIIYRINKRATVMVPDGEGIFQDQQGQKYSKWYVPITALEKI
ncbi:MAG: SprT family zinc-dependent metalloprotease [Firmicutes bacterium]|nr:SprT family zinc-dependent metalloprotease [Bacillota bacterium]